MTATNHALTGAAIATLIKQPLLIIPLAFASHFFCDALPHFKLKIRFGSKAMWRYLYAEAAIMALVATSLLLIGTKEPILLLVIAAAVAMSPDLSWYVYGKTGRQGKPHTYNIVNKIHYNIQWSESKWGIIPEVVWAGLMINVII